MIFWKRSSFIDSVRYSAGCNYFFYLKTLQIFFSRGSAVEGSRHFFHTVHSFWLSAGNTQEIKWLWKIQQRPGQGMKSPKQNGKSPKSASSSFGCLCPLDCCRGKIKQVNLLICCFLTETKCHYVHRQGTAAGIAQEVQTQTDKTDVSRRPGKWKELPASTFNVLVLLWALVSAGLAQSEYKTGQTMAKESRPVPC